MTSETRELNSE